MAASAPAVFGIASEAAVKPPPCQSDRKDQSAAIAWYSAPSHPSASPASTALSSRAMSSQAETRGAVQFHALSSSSRQAASTASGKAHRLEPRQRRRERLRRAVRERRLLALRRRDQPHRQPRLRLVKGREALQPLRLEGVGGEGAQRDGAASRLVRRRQAAPAAARKMGDCPLCIASVQLQRAASL